MPVLKDAWFRDMSGKLRHDPKMQHIINVAADKALMDWHRQHNQALYAEIIRQVQLHEIRKAGVINQAVSDDDMLEEAVIRKAGLL